MTKRAATVYFQAGSAYTTPESFTTDGFWVSTPPLCFVNNAADLRATAESILSALDQSQSGMPTPDPSQSMFSHVLAAANVTSFRAFARGSDGGVTIEATGDMADLTPIRCDDPRQGFVPDSSAKITVPLEIADIADALEGLAPEFG